MAQGYRYSVQKGVIERTGEISIDSKPKGARVMIDDVAPVNFLGRLEGKKEVLTPARIKTVLSGQYRVTIEKDGFFPWKGRVMVLPGRAAVLSGVELLPRPSEVIVPIRATIVQIIPMSGSRFVYRTEDGHIGVYDSRAKVVESLFDPHEKVVSLLVSPSGKKVFVEGEKHFWIVRNDGRLLATAIPIGLLKSFAWSHADGLYALDVRGVVFFSEKNIAFVHALSGLYAHMYVDEKLTTIDRTGAVQTYTFGKPDHPIRTSFSLKKAPSGVLISGEGRFFVFSDARHDNLVLVDKTNPIQPFETISRAHSIRWLNSTTGIAWDDFEASMVSIDNAGNVSTSLITRQSEQIRDVVAVQGVPYIFLLTKNGAIDAHDISGGDQNNRYRYFDDSTRVVSAICQGKTMIAAGEFKGVSGLTIVSLQE
ncbi:MAG: PEGA domain-containing protein [bacterium]|nr:PEGA domain-containing protein [bacterium]